MRQWLKFLLPLLLQERELSESRNRRRLRSSSQPICSRFAHHGFDVNGQELHPQLLIRRPTLILVVSRVKDRRRHQMYSSLLSSWSCSHCRRDDDGVAGVELVCHLRPTFW